MTDSADELRVRLPKAQGVAFYPPGATFGPRQTRDFEFVWIIEGDVVYHCDGVDHPAPQNAIILCVPGLSDAFTWDPKRPARHGFFHFDVASIPADWPPPGDWPRVVTPRPGELMVTLFRHVLAWAATGDGDMIRRTIALMLRLQIVGEESSHDVPGIVRPDAVERALAFLYARLDADPAAELSLDDLAEEACVSPEHLSRLFKRSTGQSPMACVRCARLDRSLVMLTRTNFSVGQIAHLCGFASQFHFARLFRAAYGDTPTRIRARSRGGEPAPFPLLHRRTPLPRPDQKQA